MEDSPVLSGDRAHLAAGLDRQRLIAMLCLTAVLLAAILIPPLVVSKGWVPRDDVLRHHTTVRLRDGYVARGKWMDASEDKSLGIAEFNQLPLQHLAPRTTVASQVLSPQEVLHFLTPATAAALHTQRSP